MNASRRLPRRSFAASTLAGLAAVALLPGRAKAAQFQFRAVSNFPVDHPIVVRTVQMWKAVERESGGRIAVEYFPGAVLGTDNATLAQLRVGALHFMNIAPAALQAIMPVVDVTNVGFAFRDARDALHVMDGALGEWIREQVNPKGIYLFRRIWDSGMREITSSARPILTPDDLHGFKIRINQSKIMIELFKGLGASPTPVNFSEMYTALQTHLADGNDSPISSIVSTRTYEVQKYVSMTEHTWSGIYMIANAEVWKSLPSDLQDVIERNNTKYALLQRHDLTLLNIALTDKLVRFGMTFNKIDHAPFRARLGAYYRGLASEFGPTEWGLLESEVGTKLG